MSYDVFKSKSPCFLLNKNINFNKNEIEPKTEKSTHGLIQTDLVLQLISELRIKNKTVRSWSS